MVSRLMTLTGLILLIGCGAGDPASRYDQAYSAFEAAATPQEYDAVIADLDGLAADLGATGPADLAFQVAYLSVRCRARKGDETTPDGVEALRKEYPEPMGRIERYLELCNDLTRGRRAMTAVKVIEKCGQWFPDARPKLEVLAKSVAAQGGKEVASALEGLGYLGGGGD